MSLEAIVYALSLPRDALIETRVPKKMLAGQGAPTAADRRQINDGIEKILWIAALKPSNIGVPEYRDQQRRYSEIAVIALYLRANAKSARLIELTHRAVPYPVLLIAEQETAVTVSTAHKRISQAEADKVVVEDLQRTHPLVMERLSDGDKSFLYSMALSLLPSNNLFALYQGWHDRIIAHSAERITGVFQTPDSQEQTEAMMQALETHARIQREITGLRAQASKEKQINRCVDLNMQIKKLETELSAAEEMMKVRRL